MAANHINQRLIKTKLTRLCTSHVCPIRDKHNPDVLLCTSCLAVINHVLWEQPRLFMEAKILGLLPYMKDGPQHDRKQSVLGQWGSQVRGMFVPWISYTQEFRLKTYH